jgi:hypothetical protein
MTRKKNSTGRKALMLAFAARALTGAARTLTIRRRRLGAAFSWQGMSPRRRGPHEAGTETFFTIVSLAHVLGLTVTAEGVETTNQTEWLESMGVAAGQGWHLGRPMGPSSLG